MVEETSLDGARALVAAGRFDAAERVFADIVSRVPSLPDAQYGLGFCLLALDRAEEAITPLERAAALRPDHPKTLNALGSALLAAGHAAAATARFQQAVDLSQGDVPDFLVNHAMAARAAGLPDAALTSLDRILTRAPNAAQALVMKAGALADRGDLTEAAEAAEQAIALMPNDAVARLTASTIYRRLRHSGPALIHAEAAAQLTPDDPNSRLELGRVYLLAERGADAAAAFRAAETGPPDPERLASIAFGWERLNESEEMARLADKALALSPDGYRPGLAKAQSDRRSGRLSTARDRMKALAARPEASSDRGFHFSHGQLLDRMEESEAAWMSFVRANDLAAAQPHAAELAQEERHDLSRMLAAAQRMPDMPTWEDGPGDSPRPVFVVGFPRSGTTLVDRILGAHPDCTVLEEKPLLERVETQFQEMLGPYPDMLGKAGEADAARLRAFYRSDLTAFAIPGPFVIDKQPLNMKRVGLIRLLFPSAPIVFVERHPLDIVLSGLMQDFRLNRAMARMTDQEDIAQAFLDTRALCELLLAKTGARPIRLRYEDLIKNPQQAITPVLQTVGLSWCEEMADFQSRSVKGRVVRSASYAQVAETVSDRSIGRWRRYRHNLAPAIARLSSICEEMGYRI